MAVGISIVRKYWEATLWQARIFTAGFVSKAFRQVSKFSAFNATWAATATAVFARISFLQCGLPLARVSEHVGFNSIDFATLTLSTWDVN